jgi:RNA polymerase sigma-70 factor, ECF subfamily
MSAPASDPTDEQAFADAVGDLLDDLFRYACALVGDTHAAEDLVQDTVVRAVERRHQFRGDASLRTWLHRILHNLAIDRHRRAVREVQVDDVEAVWREDSYTIDAVAVVERASDRAELQDALVHLPVIYRSAVLLHDVEGFTMREVAATFDIELPAAKQRLRRGRMMLVSELARGHERRAALAGVPLRCWDARALISDYLDGELAPADARAVEQHLGGCPTCPPLYAGVVGVHEALGRLRDPDSVVPDAIAARLRDV